MGARHLPGGLVLLNRTVVEDHESAEVAAGYLLAETERSEATDPLLPLLAHAGLPATIRLATTGALPPAALAAYAEVVLTRPPAPLEPGPLATRFARAGVPLSPYAYALDITGETTLPLIEADPVAPDAARELLTDGDWVSLQGVCG